MTWVHSDRLGWARLAVIAAAVMIAAHGLIHLLGVALLWELGELPLLRAKAELPALAVDTEAARHPVRHVTRAKPF